MEELIKKYQPSFCVKNITCITIDNLDLLVLQKSQSVDLIYCDILYGTGKKFNDFQDIKAIRYEIESHYFPRLKEMYRVLKPNGSIYLQMDSKISHWLRIILDDVFGYSNMINFIIWNYQRWANCTRNFTRESDHILLYSKSKNYTFNNHYVPFSEKSKHKGSRHTNIDNGHLSQKYTNEKRLKNMSDVWNISCLNSMSNERVDYSTQKPKELIERIIKTSSNEGDLVADYYLGSGTTAVVCDTLNRNFIGCDINKKSIQITRSRIVI